MVQVYMYMYSCKLTNVLASLVKRVAEGHHEVDCHGQIECHAGPRAHVVSNVKCNRLLCGTETLCMYMQPVYMYMYTCTPAFSLHTESSSPVHQAYTHAKLHYISTGDQHVGNS